MWNVLTLIALKCQPPLLALKTATSRSPMFFIDADSAPSPLVSGLEPLGKSLVYSASDLVLSAQCQFAALYALDQALGRCPA